ncbi:hypothetical protein PUNSTDRAFT_119086 [Punctularia strigosozonata HHB-11173 SS5]|uniref:uncharacterized protein n=1 Tax=Punctularia strigosozonata (strain HHB-11173) TaxID=741275 RepID=UPI0004416383|nr:uncharacterized protein PUNSTDRAFT_119086 [Punctularia strigosozonata HHB-11173 SS5]EIN11871.1 hypothetical protein PUNSTDRAFT_119086 [Punctularia strigosozonata HHB-11173 SS5]
MADTTRVVPGAPPPPTSKSQHKKKRKGAKAANEPSTPATPVVVLDTLDASTTEKAPGLNDVYAGTVAPDLVAPTVSADGLTAAEARASPIIQLLTKRQKALGKKISRVETYASSDPATLNQDQRETLKTLPSLHAVHKEVEEIKKAIEAHEAELAIELAAQRVEAERIQNERVASAIAATEALYTSKLATLLSFIRLQSLLSQGHPQVASLSLSEPESAAIHGVTNTLLGDAEEKDDILSGFLSGAGDYEGVAYARLHDITQLYLNPPAPEPEEILEEAIEAALEEAIAEEPAVVVVPAAAPLGGGISFMQDSELEEPAPQESMHATVEETTVTEVTINGQIVEETVEVEKTEIEISGNNDNLNWADDDGGLPPISEVQASFGTPEGSGTPAPEAAAPQASAEPRANGPPPVEGEDGFMTPHRGGRGRGGSRGSFRGERGGHRGDYRGGYRGDRGGFRGEGRGRGGFRGGERGGYRGRGDGEWRGGGGGEYRGRGRGRGRGDRGGSHGESRGGSPATPVA